MNQRYYSSQLGRFTTPDPGGIRTASPSDPQSWNRYSYVEGDPINYQDPSGRFMMAPDFGDFGSGGGPEGTACVLIDGMPYCPVLPSIAPDPIVDDPIVDADNLIAAENARIDLAKEKCFKLLAFASAAAAQSWFDNHITFVDVFKGRLKVQNGAPAENTPAPADTSSYGTIYINRDYNWPDFSKTPTQGSGVYNYLGYMNRALGTHMTSAQLGAMIVIHELEHNRPQDAAETVKDRLDIYNDCIK